jgi:probable rRNA maturation factor
MTPNEGKASKRLTVNVRILPLYAKDVERASVQKAARAAFKSAGGQGAWALTVMVTDNAQILKLNLVYLGVDAPTDVLAFGAADEANGFILPPGETQYWGDIVISYPRAMEQAATYGHPLQEELSLLVVHGTLHLMGYDHEQADDKEKMWGAQHSALVQLGICWQP